MTNLTPFYGLGNMSHQLLLGNSSEHDNYHQLLKLISKFSQPDGSNSTLAPDDIRLVSEFMNQSLAYSHRDGDAGRTVDSALNEDIDTEEVPIDLWVKLIIYAIYLIICLLGIFGNAIVCFVVARNPTMHTVTNVFIANLALSDIFLCLFAVPFTPLYLVTFKRWIFGRALCHLVPFAQGVSNYRRFSGLRFLNPSFR